jgi:hypothetical protein
MLSSISVNVIGARAGQVAAGCSSHSAVLTSGRCGSCGRTENTPRSVRWNTAGISPRPSITTRPPGTTRIRSVAPTRADRSTTLSVVPGKLIPDCFRTKLLPPSQPTRYPAVNVVSVPSGPRATTATWSRFRWSQPIEVPDTGHLRDDAIGLLRNADAARTRVITLVSVQLMEYFRDSGSSFSELRETFRPSGRAHPGS